MNRLLPILFYLSAGTFLFGLLWRFSTWLHSRVPLNIVLTPAPSTTAGVAKRLTTELVLFRSLLAADPWLWAIAWLFHLSLLLLAIGHFGGLVIPDFARTVLGLTEPEFHHLARITGAAFGLLAFAPLLCLLVRRLTNQRLRYFSTFADYTALALLLLVIITGNQMRFVDGLDLAQARQFVSGLLSLHPGSAPTGAIFTIHLLLVCALLVYFPFSKLVHVGALLFNPTLNLRNNPRERRHQG